MNLHIDILKTFISVADTKGFTSASRLVNRTQSAVSMQIKRLEGEVGKQLFERCGKTVNLTYEGRQLLDYAKRIVKAHDKAAAAIARPPLNEIIRFGSPEQYTVNILPNLLAQFSSAYPDVCVEIQSHTSDVIEKLIETGDLDIGLCTQIHQGGQVICSDPVVWMAKPGFTMEEGKPLTLAVYQENCIFRTWALDAINNAGINYRIGYVSQDVNGIINSVRTGIAIAPVVKSTVPPDLIIIGTEAGLPLLPVSNVVLHRTKMRKPLALESFAEFLITSFRNEG